MAHCIRNIHFLRLRDTYSRADPGQELLFVFRMKGNEISVTLIMAWLPVGDCWSECFRNSWDFQAQQPLHFQQNGGFVDESERSEEIAQTRSS